MMSGGLQDRYGLQDLGEHFVSGVLGAMPLHASQLCTPCLQSLHFLLADSAFLLPNSALAASNSALPACQSCIASLVRILGGEPTAVAAVCHSRLFASTAAITDCTSTFSLHLVKLAFEQVNHIAPKSTDGLRARSEPASTYSTSSCRNCRQI